MEDKKEKLYGVKSMAAHNSEQAQAKAKQAKKASPEQIKALMQLLSEQGGGAATGFDAEAERGTMQAQIMQAIARRLAQELGRQPSQQEVAQVFEAIKSGGKVQ